MTPLKRWLDEKWELGEMVIISTIISARMVNMRKIFLLTRTVMVNVSAMTTAAILKYFNNATTVFINEYKLWASQMIILLKNVPYNVKCNAIE
jgi:hypothetical protein